VFLTIGTQRLLGSSNTHFKAKVLQCLFLDFQQDGLAFFFNPHHGGISADFHYSVDRFTVLCKQILRALVLIIKTRLQLQSLAFKSVAFDCQQSLLGLFERGAPKRDYDLLFQFGFALTQTGSFPHLIEFFVDLSKGRHAE